MEKIISLVPAVLPMNGVCIDPPLPVRVLKRRQGTEMGKTYYLRYVLPEGQCLIYKSLDCLEMVPTNPLKMGDLVEMLTQMTPANDK